MTDEARAKALAEQLAAVMVDDDQFCWNDGGREKIEETILAALAAARAEGADDLGWAQHGHDSLTRADGTAESHKHWHYVLWKCSKCSCLQSTKPQASPTLEHCDNDGAPFVPVAGFDAQMMTVYDPALKEQQPIVEVGLRCYECGWTWEDKLPVTCPRCANLPPAPKGQRDAS